MSNENKDFYDIKRILREYSILIPSIQRPYAQGRESEKNVRSSFLNFLFADGQNKKLGSVYGLIKNGYFIPIDGQQRLTTLFLIYFVSALKNDKTKGEFLSLARKNGLLRFNYASTPYINDFLRHLICKETMNALRDESSKISDAIKDFNWYVPRYDMDQSIKGILTMLDAIKEKNESIDVEDIKFPFLDFSENSNLQNTTSKGLDADKVFIKMNSTGEQLSDWDLVKADLVKLLPTNLNDFSNLQWKDFLDNELMTSLIELRETSNTLNIEDVKETEKYAFYLIYNVLCFISKDPNLEYDTTHIKSKINELNSSDEIISLVKEAKNIMNIPAFINSNDWNIISNELKRLFTDNQSGRTYNNRCLLYMLLKAKLSYKENNKHKLANTIHMYLNLNTLCDNVNAETFATRIEGIDALINYAIKDNFSLEEDSKEDFNKIKGFYPEVIVLEEVLKINIKNKSEEFSDFIIKAEQNAYLKGSLATLFLMEESIVFKEENFSNLNNYVSSCTINDLESNWEKVETIFPHDKEDIKNEEWFKDGKLERCYFARIRDKECIIDRLQTKESWRRRFLTLLENDKENAERKAIRDTLSLEGNEKIIEEAKKEFDNWFSDWNKKDPDFWRLCLAASKVAYIEDRAEENVAQDKQKSKIFAYPDTKKGIRHDWDNGYHYFLNKSNINGGYIDIELLAALFKVKENVENWNLFGYHEGWPTIWQYANDKKDDHIWFGLIHTKDEDERHKFFLLCEQCDLKNKEGLKITKVEDDKYVEIFQLNNPEYINLIAYEINDWDSFSKIVNEGRNIIQVSDESTSS